MPLFLNNRLMFILFYFCFCFENFKGGGGGQKSFRVARPAVKASLLILKFGQSESKLSKSHPSEIYRVSKKKRPTFDLL